MYENKTYENLIDEVLKTVSNDIDKSEGSLIFNAVAPAAWEISNVYISLDTMYNMFFFETADKEELIMRAVELGLSPNEGKSAIVKAEFNTEIPLESRFSIDDINYSVIEKIEDGIYKLECEEVGKVGNKLGTLTALEYIEDLEKSELIEILEQGEEEEETEHFRQRCFNYMKKPSTSGNKYDYYNWAMQCIGVGAVKVFPLALGAGTVKLVIADNDKRQASEELLKKVKEHIEEVRPIGATISVVSVQEKKISVTANIKLKNGIVLGSIQENFKQSLEEYFSQNSFDMTYVSIAKLGNILLDTIGVEDYSDLKLNNQTGNISLEQEEVAVVGKVELGVI